MSAPQPSKRRSEEFDALVRGCLEDIQPYVPGKPIAEVRRELGLKRVIKLASNENPLGASPKGLKAFREAAKYAWVYPEGASPILREMLEDRLGLPKGSVLVGNGSDEVSRMVCEVFLEKGDEAVCSQNAFIRFRQCAKLMGAETVLAPEKDFRHDVDALAERVTRRTKMLYLASPNNPTGSYCTREELERLLRAVPQRVIIVVDEAYYEYAREHPDYPETLPRLVRRFPNLVVLRTFSKAYGLAGLRVGYGAADPGLVAWIDRIRMPFNVNILAQAAARAALDDRAFVKKSVDLVRREKVLTAKGLESLGLRVRPSAANFVMASSRLDNRELFGRLLRRGVIVRPLSEYGLRRELRISIGSPGQNRRMLKAMKDVLR